jgi:hypothetical protein
MRFKALWGVINAVMLVVVSWGAFSYLVGLYNLSVIIKKRKIYIHLIEYMTINVI